MNFIYFFPMLIIFSVIHTLAGYFEPPLGYLFDVLSGFLFALCFWVGYGRGRQSREKKHILS